jgi:hypothetical protein
MKTSRREALSNDAAQRSRVTKLDVVLATVQTRRTKRWKMKKPWNRPRILAADSRSPMSTWQTLCNPRDPGDVV